MKHLLIALMLLAPYITQSQSYQTNRPELINPIFESIVKRGLQEGIQVDLILIGRLVEIEVVEKTPRDAGAEVEALGGIKAKIYISEQATKDLVALEWILAHEIGHVVGIGHCCEDKFCIRMMAAYTPVDKLDIIYQMKVMETIDKHNWQEFFSHRNWGLLQSRL